MAQNVMHASDELILLNGVVEIRALEIAKFFL
jgi:hypothetical protein